MAMAAKDYDDSKWEITRPAIRYRQNANKTSDTFSSICWLRFHFRADSSIVNIPLALRVTHYGASEIYLDGKKIAGYGITTGDSLDYYDPQEVPLVMSVPDTGIHVLAVRYANYEAKLNALRQHRTLAGPKMSLSKSESAIIVDHWNAITITFIFTLLFGIFLTFSIVHLFLYFFYRAAKSNLFFSILCFCISCAFLMHIMNTFSHDPNVAIFNSFLYFILLSIGIFSFCGFTTYLFAKKMIRFKIITIAAILAPFVLTFNGNIGFMLYLVMLVFVFVEAIIVTILGIYRKVKGARIIGSGILFCTLFFLSNIVFAMIRGNDTISDDTLLGKIYIILLICAILSMPVFMSIYLAWSFAHMNKDLKNKLVQVEELSAQTLAQEQEKKQILENQNVRLESEVAARTAEVLTQKEKIEKQHDELKTEKKKSDDLLLNI